MKKGLPIAIGISILALGLGILRTNNKDIIAYISASQLESIGFSCVFIGILILILSSVFFIVKSILVAKKIIQKKIENRFQLEFNDFFPSINDIDELNILIDECLGRSRTSNIDLLKKYYNANKKSFVFIIKNNDKSKLIGSYVVHPLTKDAHELIQKGVIQSGKQFAPEHISKKFNKAYALYIGTIVAKGRNAKAWTLLLLKRALQAIINRNKKIHSIYARPRTSDGKRLLEKYNFSPITEDSEIWSVEVSSMNRK